MNKVIVITGPTATGKTALGIALAEKIGGVPYRQGIFSTWNDPAKFGLFYHAALMTRRGDVAPAKNFTKIKPLSRSEWDEDIMKANFEKTGIVADTEIGGVASEATVDKEILSDTGELYIDREKNYGWIDTDMTKCAYGFLLKNGRIDLKGMSVECETDFAVIALSSLTEDSIVHQVSVQFSSVQSLSRVRLFVTMNHSTPGLPVHHQLPEFTQTHGHRVSDAIQPSHPWSSPSPPAFHLSQHQGLFQ